MTYFLKDGNTFSQYDEESLNVHDSLPVGTYTIKVNPFGKLYLEIINDFEINHKLYGDTIRHTNRIFNTFMDRPATTGVMLSGEKGSGKSLLAKNLSIIARENDIATIVINDAFKGETFNQFIQGIEQPCVLIFDEFEKVYDRQDQEQILTLLDGTYPSKKLIILTCNDKYKVDTNMKNRPGRIYYLLDYSGLSNEFITDYCNDNLNNKGHIDSLCKMASLFGEFNFDMLKAIVEEMNRYDETPQEVMAILNTKPELDTEQRYSVVIEDDGKTYEPTDLSPSVYRGNPLSRSFEIGFYITSDSKPVSGNTPVSSSDGTEPERDSYWYYSNFEPANLISLDPESGSFVFVNDEDTKVTLTRVKDAKFNFNAF